MRRLSAVLCLIFVLNAGCDQPGGQSADVATIEAIDNAVGDLDGAFEAQNAAAIKALMTPDHLAVTHYYGAPLSVDEQIATLPDLKYKQSNLSEPRVSMLGPDTAMRTLTARLDGTYEGTPISGKVFITSIMARRGGQWLEHFYQVTELKQ